MIGRGIGAAVAKSPMGTASRSPRCFMPVSGMASRYYVYSIEIHTGSHHSCVGGYELIHDSDPASKVIRRKLSIGIPRLDGSSLPASASWRPQTGLIDSPGLAEWQPVSGADLSFDNLLEKMFQFGVLIVAAKTQTDRRVEPFEAAGAFVLEPSL